MEDPTTITDLFGDIATEASSTILAVAGVGVGVLVLLVGIGVGLRVFGKFGVRR